MKAQRKLIPAVAMLLVALVVMSTASYAWFTMSRNVQVNGLDLTAVAPTNLLISTDGVNFGSSADLVNYEGGKLYPASSLDGEKFFAPQNIGSTGVADENSGFEEVTTAVGNSKSGYYADYTLYFKTNGDQNVPVTFDKNVFPKFSGEDASSNLLKAIRVAVVSAKVGSDDIAINESKYIYRAESDAYPASLTGPVVKTGAADDYKGVADAYTYSEDEAIFTVEAGKTVTVVIRVWLEGQSENCTSSEAQEVKFNIGFKDVIEDLNNTTTSSDE